MESAGFNVVSWNVNGLRTINIGETLAQMNCFILGIQETKLASKFFYEVKCVRNAWFSKGMNHRAQSPNIFPCLRNLKFFSLSEDILSFMSFIFTFRNFNAK